MSAARVIVGTGAANMRALGGDRLPEIKHPITAAPVVTGAYGRAWLCDVAEAVRRAGLGPDDHGCLSHWIVEAPWAHPVWHSYALVLVHLRPLAAGRQTLLYLEGATHEIWLSALDPDVDRNDMLAAGVVAGWLRPMNFAAQFIEIADELARGRVQQTVQAICDGRLIPDTDARADWISLYGDNMQRDRPRPRPQRRCP